MDLRDVLVPQIVRIDGIKLKDYVQIEPAEKVDNYYPNTAGASDLAVACGARLSAFNYAFNHKKRTFFWTNTKKGVDGIVNIRGNGNDKMGQRVDGGIACVRPLIRVKTSDLANNHIDYRLIKSTTSDVTEAVIDGFSFPQSVVEEPLAGELEGACASKRSPVHITVFNESGATRGDVYQYNDQLYLRFDMATPDRDSSFANGDSPNGNRVYWFKFEPIVWLVRWNEDGEMYLCAEDGLIGNIKYHDKFIKDSSLWQNSLIRSYLNGLNLEESIKSGNGNPRKATGINYDFSNEGFIDALQLAFDYSRFEASKYGIPVLVPIVSTTKTQQHKKVKVSNGIKSEEANEERQSDDETETSVKEENNSDKRSQQDTETKSEKQRQAEENIAKASIPEYDLEDTDSISAPKIEKVGEEPSDKDDDGDWGIAVSDIPLSTEEQIKFYIEHGRSFMLHGVSGIGKSRRIQDADPDCVQIQLRNGILPEEVIGKTGFDPVNGKSFWIEPTWYTRIKEVCTKDPNHNHVLFIDEITNVRPYEQSLVFNIVLEHSIDGNYGRLPKNCVVVAAGNNPKESEAAYNMPEPLFRRFSGHIYLRPNQQEFLTWASKPKRDNPKRKNIHPFIAEFVVSRGLLYTDYDKDSSTFAIDPRGWEQVSDIIYDSKGLIDFNLISNKIGVDNARALIDFAKQPRITVSGIVNNTYPKTKLPTTANGKYALILSLVNANFDEFVKVRKFIEKNVGIEYKEVYDSLWVGNDDEKALFVARLNGEKDLEK